nr:unnamed protein product [Spirometra erinaceieuropaei]
MASTVGFDSAADDKGQFANLKLLLISHSRIYLVTHAVFLLKHTFKHKRFSDPSITSKIEKCLQDAKSKSVFTVHCGSETITFDKGNFKVDKGLRLSRESIRILQLPWKLRRKSEAQQAANELLMNRSSLRSLTTSVQEACVNKGWYERFLPDQIIIAQNRPGLSFYFIISGEVEVRKSEHNSRRLLLGKTVARLRSGQSFAEMALFTGDLRNATVVCTKVTEVLTLNRRDFVKACEASPEPLFKECIEGLKKVLDLDGWPTDHIPKYPGSAYMIATFKPGMVICCDLEEIENVVVLLEGKCKVLTSLEWPSPNQPSPKATMVELDVLYPGDVYGIEAALFADSTDHCQSTLISCGAKCVTINKEFFKQFVTEDYLTNLQKRFKQLPTKTAVRKKLTEIQKWTAYKRKVVNEVLQLK